MPVTVQSIVKEVQRAVNDFAGDRVPASDVVDLMTRAQRMIYSERPDSTAAVSPYTLVPGAEQALPANAASLIDIQANSTGTRQRITKVDMPLMDAFEPNWRSRAASTVIEHFMHDLRTPRFFWVYPPAAAGAQVDLEASSYPADIPAPSGDGRAWSTAVGEISLADEFEPALTALTLHLVYRSDLEGVLNPALSDAYLAQASAMLGVQLSASAVVAPKT